MKPKQLFPVEPKGLDDIARALLEGSATTEISEDEASKVETKLGDPKSYIRIPNTKILIAKQETHKGESWKQTLYALGDEGLFMPSPGIFLPYFLKVKEAAEGKITLYDGSNNPIRKPEVDDLYKYMTSGHRGGCWTWLDARFVQEGRKWYVEANHRVDPSGRAKKLASTKQPLENCLREDVYAELKFNSQGLATSKSRNQNYVLGNNIYFYHPRDSAVVGFEADSDGGRLYCSRNPTLSYPGLGVFACAEGTAPKSGDKK